ncbi:unnamed protein product [Linum tenue]|uniref:Glutathione hydrolase n=1 Tax=Linum tenue TaxID=586396 RepID=A0AAV0PY65_9ROSI|nr:unnamed protein product [Linum tenue]
MLPKSPPWRHCPLLVPLLLLVLLPLTSPSDLPADRPPPAAIGRFGNRVVAARRGVVATDDGRCSWIGRNVLRRGGNAVDAAVAAAFCLGVVSSASSGIGGGAFMIVRMASGEAQAFDMREVAPIKASQNMYAGNASLKSSGPLSIAVPGELAGLYEAWKRHGRLPWKRLVLPSVFLAGKGYKLSKYLHFQMTQISQSILADRGLAGVYATESGSRLKRPGEICRNRKLAVTLAKIAFNGVREFYNGSIGRELVRDVERLGGILTVEDLARYRVRVREPVSAEIMGMKLIGMPPPSSGGAAMFMILNILAQYGVPKGISGPLGVHRLIESLKHAFAVRMNLGDPDFANGVEQVLSDMISPKFAAEIKKTIYDNTTFGPDHYGGRWNQIDDHGTSHVSIVDGERNAVAMTSTVNYYFGARILSPSTGIVLNNEMDDFSIPSNNGTGGGNADVPPPAPTNFVRPGKRPLSSMAPTIVLEDGKLRAVMGASGGAMIIAATTEVFLNYFGKGMDPLSSVLAPRLYHQQLIPNKVSYENWTTVYRDHFEVPAETRAFLERRGHVLQGLAGGTISQLVVQEFQGDHRSSLKNNNGTTAFGRLVGVSDPRKGGFPAGF